MLVGTSSEYPCNRPIPGDPCDPLDPDCLDPDPCDDPNGPVLAMGGGVVFEISGDVS